MAFASATPAGFRPDCVEFYAELAGLAASRNQGATITTRWLDRPAIVEVSPQQGTQSEVTFGQFIGQVVARAASLGRTLSSVGGPAVSSPVDGPVSGQPVVGARVGLLGKNSIKWLVDFYALQLIGAVPVPLSYKYPKAAFQHVLVDAGVRLLLIDDDSQSLVAALDTDIAERLTVEALGDETPVAVDHMPEILRQPEPSDLAMVLYTSGSTGNPKGVGLSHASHVWVLDTVSAARETSYAVEVAAPLYHMNALARSQKALASGETIVLLTEFDAATYVAAISEHNVAELTGVPPMFALLEPVLAVTPTNSSVVHVNMASAPAGDALFAAMAAHFPNALVTIGYGTTESGPVAFYVPQDVVVPVGSVGVPHPAVETRLIDPATGDTNDTFGVLEIKTGALFAEYLNQPLANRPITADGFYHTKDLFRVDNGHYFFAGREDDMFNSGAENVYPAAVEAILLSHPAVKETVVVPVPDAIKTWKPVAFVTLTEGTPRNTEHAELERDLKRYTLEHLEPFAHPRRIWILEHMPLAATNKIDRTYLALEAARLVGK